MVKIIFEDIPDNEIYHYFDEKSKTEKTIRWKELKKQFKQLFESEKMQKILEKKGIKKVEIGTIAWFHFRRKTRGRFIPLTTMFMARLLKR